MDSGQQGHIRCQRHVDMGLPRIIVPMVIDHHKHLEIYVPARNAPPVRPNAWRAKVDTPPERVLTQSTPSLSKVRMSLPTRTWSIRGLDALPLRERLVVAS